MLRQVSYRMDVNSVSIHQLLIYSISVCAIIGFIFTLHFHALRAIVMFLRISQLMYQSTSFAFLKWQFVTHHAITITLHHFISLKYDFTMLSFMCVGGVDKILLGWMWCSQLYQDLQWQYCLRNFSCLQLCTRVSAINIVMSQPTYFLSNSHVDIIIIMNVVDQLQITMDNL